MNLVLPRFAVTLVRICLIGAVAASCATSRSGNSQGANLLTINQTWEGEKLQSKDEANVSVNWLKNGDLRIVIDAPFANDPKPICEKASCWKLWEYEVVELFLAGAGDPAPYTEVEISPWGNYLVIQLLGERNMVATDLPLDVRLISREGKRWWAEAVLDKKLIPNGNLLVNAYRVSGVESNRHYHVMTPMDSEQPDFHLVSQFVRELGREN